jgi:glycosyltransferase involved in cell wall biosynthesis
MFNQSRLAFFLPNLDGGGAQRVVLNLIKGIVAHGYQVDLVLAQAKGPYLAQVPEAVRLIDLNASRSLYSLWPLVHYLKRVHPEALLSAMHVNLVALWARRLAGVSTRVVVSEHNVLSYASQHALTWRGRFLPPLTRFYRWADEVVAVSEGAGDHLAGIVGMPRQRIQVIYNPVVSPELQQKLQSPLEHPWFQPDQPPVLLAAGRLAAEKDFSTLIHAFAHVRQTRPARLMILGEGEERSGLEAQIRQLGLEKDVSLPGFVDNPYAYMIRAALFVLSSKSEALPTVLIEALYCGLPLVSTDCPGGAREILDHGRYGQLVPVGDRIALAQAILVALAGQPPCLSQDAWHLFDLEIVVRQYLNVLLGRQECLQ